jgi:hypothetical protein
VRPATGHVLGQSVGRYGSSGTYTLKSGERGGRMSEVVSLLMYALCSPSVEQILQIDMSSCFCILTNSYLWSMITSHQHYKNEAQETALWNASRLKQSLLLFFWWWSFVKVHQERWWTCL